VITRNALAASTTCWRASCTMLRSPAGKQRGVSGGVALIDKCLDPSPHPIHRTIRVSISIILSSIFLNTRLSLPSSSVVVLLFSDLSTCTLH
jgi:hypothetical protein